MIDGPNLFSYCGNNPVNLIDPLGLCADKPWWENIDFDDVLNNLDDFSNAILLNPMADGTPFPFEQGAGVIGLGVVKVGKIVIGETGTRVAKKALKIGANYYKPTKEVLEIGIKKAMSNNYQWLRRKVKQGYEIINIGLDRKREGTRGIFYQAEKKWLKLWGK
jgi:hypothetical protein